MIQKEPFPQVTPNLLQAVNFPNLVTLLWWQHRAGFLTLSELWSPIPRKIYLCACCCWVTYKSQWVLAAGSAFFRSSCTLPKSSRWCHRKQLLTAAHPQKLQTFFTLSSFHPLPPRLHPWHLLFGHGAGTCSTARRLRWRTMVGSSCLYVLGLITDSWTSSKSTADYLLPCRGVRPNCLKLKKRAVFP